MAIAGTYTPIALSVIGGRLGWLIFALQWLLVLAGILFKVFCFKKSRLSSLVSVLLYLLMGWAVALCLPVFAARAQPANFWLVVAGGLFYTSGLIFFARGRPFDHVTWHGFVMAGAFCHFLAIIFFL